MHAGETRREGERGRELEREEEGEGVSGSMEGERRKGGGESVCLKASRR